MATDRMLATVLGAYHKAPDPSFRPKILGSTASLLTTLSNPLNISLLTSQLLTAPAIWEGPIQLDDCLKVIGIFNSAAIKVLKQTEEIDSALLGYPRQGGGLKPDEWATTAVKGADEKSPRWRHCLVIAGILLGMEGQQRRGLSRALRMRVESALVLAANLSMQEPGTYQLGKEAALLALNHTFDLLSEDAKKMINHDLVAPLAIDAMTGSNGYMAGSFVGLSGRDIRYTRDNRLDWPEATPSFQQHVKAISSRPLITSMGPLARLVAYTVANLEQPQQISIILERLSNFSNLLHQNWRVNLLSALDPSQLSHSLTPETFTRTYPALLQLLKSAMFATVVILQSITSGLLIDFRLSSQAPALAASSLHILRNLYFITSRLGTNAFSALTFVSLTSLDILSTSPPLAAQFLQSIAPQSPGRIPSNALDQSLDLYFLNTAEHFPLLLAPTLTTTLILASTDPYLSLPIRTSSLTPTLTELFEAAHSATLSALAAPGMSAEAARRVPSYASALFSSFPSHLSTRQFRFAFKSLLQITTPPSEVAHSHPRLPEELCEFLRFRALNASTSLLPPSAKEQTGPEQALEFPAPQLSEQAALVIALIDGLPCLTPRQLEEWLPLAAEAVGGIRDVGMRGECRRRFWEVLMNGEMDVDRSKTCVMWWSSRGGREMVVEEGRGRISGGAGDEAMMSGGLGSGQSRL